MRKKITVFLLLLGFSVGAIAYTRMVYRFEVPEVEANRILFDFALPVGTCHFHVDEEQPFPVLLEGQLKEGELKDVNFFYEEQGADYLVDFQLTHQSKFSLEEMKREHAQRSWQVSLSPKDAFGLKLSYGWGNSTIDLSKLKISHLQLSTGHANVRAIHRKGNPNELLMDSYKANVEFGSLYIEKLDMANTPFFDAEVGMGKLEVSFSDELYRNCQVNVNVGAGDFTAKLPSKNEGIRIKVASSIMASVNIPDGFHKYQGYLVNDAYLAKKFNNMVTFEVAVSVGTVTFEWDNKS